MSALATCSTGSAGQFDHRRFDRRLHAAHRPTYVSGAVIDERRDLLNQGAGQFDRRQSAIHAAHRPLGLCRDAATDERPGDLLDWAPGSSIAAV